MPAGDMEQARFHRDLLIILNKIVFELHESNKLSKDINYKFDNEIASLGEQTDETIKRNREINLELKQLNRSTGDPNTDDLEE